MPHYTSESYDVFTERITLEFIGQIAQRLEQEGMPQSELAKKLNVSESEVSQVLNLNRTNLTLKTMVRYASAVGMKSAVVAYDDGDPQNDNGPVGSTIFRLSWETLGKPRNLQAVTENARTAIQASAIVGFVFGSSFMWQGYANSTLPGQNATDMRDISYPLIHVVRHTKTGGIHA